MQGTLAGRRAAALAIAAVLALAAPAARADFKDMGTYGGSGPDGAKRIPAFERWLGHPIPRAMDFFAFGSWDEIQHMSDWAIKGWRGQRWAMTFAIPMLPNDKKSTLKEGATGAYNDQFAKLAKKLVAAGFGDAVLRIGWEFNGGWYPWAAAKCPPCFVAYWKQIVTTMRAVPGAKFRFDWNPTLGYNQIPADKVYPGDDYVDIIGLDVYNQSWNPSSKDGPSRWKELVNSNYGLAWQKKFAAAHDKPISFPEWGTGTRPDGHGAGDDPYFIEQMHAWIDSNNVAYHDYWDVPAKDYNSQLSKGKYPESGAAFLKLFGKGG
jgi:hypothetical protein